MEFENNKNLYIISQLWETSRDKIYKFMNIYILYMGSYKRLQKCKQKVVQILTQNKIWELKFILFQNSVT